MKAFATEKAAHKRAAKKWLAATRAFPVRQPKGKHEIDEEGDAREDGRNKE